MSCSNHVGPLSMKHFTCDGWTGVLWPKRHKTRYTEVERGQITVANTRYLSSFVIHFMINFSRSSSCRHGGSIMGALKSWQRAQELLQQKKKKKRRKKWASSHKKTGEFRSNLQLISLPTHAVKHCSCCPDCKIVLSQAVHWSWPSWSPR